MAAASKAATLDEITVATGGYGGVAAAASPRPTSGFRSHVAITSTPVPCRRSSRRSRRGAATLPATVTAIKSLEADLGSLNALISLDGRVVGELRTLDSRVVLATTHNAAGACRICRSVRLAVGAGARRRHRAAAQLPSPRRS